MLNNVFKFHPNNLFNGTIFVKANVRLISQIILLYCKGVMMQFALFAPWIVSTSIQKVT